MRTHDPVPALRLALRLTTGALVGLSFAPDHSPLGDVYETAEWLRSQLANLAESDPDTFAELRALLDITQRPPRGGSTPDAVRRSMRRLAAHARAGGKSRPRKRGRP